MLEIKKIEIADAGKHTRPATALGLIARQPMVPITWAANMLAVLHPPNDACCGCFWAADPDIDKARENVIADFLASEAESILIVPEDQNVRWDTLLQVWEGIEAHVRIGLVRGGATFLRRRPGDHRSSLIRLRDDLESRPDPIPTSFKPGRIDDGIDPQATLAIAVPSLGKVSLEWIRATRSLQPPQSIVPTMAILMGAEVGEAREDLVASVLATKPAPPAFLFFLGDDMIAPPEGLKVLFHDMRTLDRPAVCGLYHVKQDRPKQAVLWRHGTQGNAIEGVDFQSDEMVEADCCGLDFALLRTRDLARVPKPRFVTRRGIVGDRFVEHTEDAYFWGHWIAAVGTRPIVDTSVRVGHYDHRTGRIF